jgi:hypothetical protein
MSAEWLPEDWSARAPVMLVAGFPEAGASAAQLLEIEEAVLSFSRAAFAAGRRISLPGDHFIAPLVSQVAAEYVLPLGSESVDEGPRPVEMILAEGRDEQLDEMLAGWRHVRGVSLGRARGTHGGRHRLTSEAIEFSAPQVALAVGGAPGMADDLDLLRLHEVRLAPIVPTLAGSLREGWERLGEDVTGRILAEAGWEEAVGERTAARRTPYPYLMQQLIAEWDRPERRRR